MRIWMRNLARVCWFMAVLTVVVGIAFTWALVDTYGSQALASTSVMFIAAALLLCLAAYLLQRASRRSAAPGD